MEKKGWPKEEVERALRIISDSEKRLKYATYKASANRVLYWMIILMLTVINFIISILLIPFLITLKGFFLYLIIATLGFIFGLAFNFLLLDLEHLEKKHHIFATMFIPLMSILNLFVIVNISNRIGEVLKVDIYHYPFTISSIYVIAFILPYMFSGIKKFK